MRRGDGIKVEEEQLPQMWTLGKAQEYLKEEKGIEIPVVTLRSWFNELEKQKVHTLPRTKGKRERVLSQLEINIAIFIYEVREKYGKKIPNEIIAEYVREKFPEVTYFEDENSADSNTMDILQAEERILRAMGDLLNEKMDQMRNEIRQEYEEKERLARLALPDPAEKEAQERVAIRTIQLNIRDTERKITRELKNEAEEKWNANPIKTGIIIKKEDTAKKLEFINNYINDHIDERMKAAFEDN